MPFSRSNAGGMGDTDQFSLRESFQDIDYGCALGKPLAMPIYSV